MNIPKALQILLDHYDVFVPNITMLGFVSLSAAAIAGITAAIVAASTAAGAIAGAVPKTKENESESSSGIKMGEANTLEKTAEGVQTLGMADMLRLVGGGGEVGRADAASNEFADLLKGYSTKDLSPGADDYTKANSLASGLFRPQQVALDQSFEGQLQQANQQAALMGRDVNDPILKAKLAQEQTRQQSMLSANEGAFSLQQAMGAPRERMQRELGMMGQRSDVLQGLASQALNNRQALVAMGSGISTQEFNKRLSTGERWGKSSSKEKTGGSVGEMVAGGIAGGVQGFASGVSSAASMGGGFGGMGGGGMSAGGMGTFWGGSNPYSQGGGGFSGGFGGQAPSFSQQTLPPSYATPFSSQQQGGFRY